MRCRQCAVTWGCSGIAHSTHEETMNPNQLENCETKAVRTYFTDVDKTACDTLRARYGALVPPERLSAMDEAPSQFDSPKEFRKAFRSEEHTSELQSLRHLVC